MCNRGDIPTNNEVIIKQDEQGNEVVKTFYVKRRISNREFEKYYEPLMKNLGVYKILKQDKKNVWLTFKVCNQIPIGCVLLNKEEEKIWNEYNVM